MAPRSKHRDDAPITIKKYANRRLYNTATSSYVTLDDLSTMIKQGEDFIVYDAKSGDDITRSVLTQIIVEEESKGQHMLPISFLRQLIGFYGGNMQNLVPQYLDYSMQAFAKNQEQFHDYFRDAMGGMLPMKSLEQMSKQNMALFEQAMRLWQPDEAMAERPAPQESSAKTEAKANLDELTRRIDELQQQVKGLSGSETGKS